jgi:hypothetical protein
MARKMRQSISKMTRAARMNSKMNVLENMNFVQWFIG